MKKEEGMTIPDRIELVRIIPVPRERVWAAITQPEQLAHWFEPEPYIDLRVGGGIRMGSAHPTGEITVVDPPHRFAFLWYAAPEAGSDHSLPVTQTAHTLVTFTLEEVAEGTRLTFVESGFASLPGEAVESYLKRNQKGWNMALTNLEQMLAGKQATDS
jgi:uncharacterized protein YndB with AHSA1/START domain